MADTIALPRDPRKRLFYVVLMLVDKHGQGPAAFHDAERLTWEVWDQEMASHASFDTLPDAIENAEQRNEVGQMVILAEEILRRKAKVLLGALDLDDHGVLVGNRFMGGGGGMLSQATLMAADELRRELAKPSGPRNAA